MFHLEAEISVKTFFAGDTFQPNAPLKSNVSKKRKDLHRRRKGKRTS
jgi:hypothetical protein